MSTQSISTQREANMISAGDLVLLVTLDSKEFLVTVKPEQVLHTHRGRFQHDSLVGQTFGATVNSELGHPALMLAPSLHDLMRHIRRGTQVIYAKDAAYLVHRLGLHAGSTVIEAGTGSGALTMALAWAVAPTGRVYTYEVRSDTFELARKNLARVGLLQHVDMHCASIDEGFAQTGVDALFLDVREPWRYLAQVHAALRPGGQFACLLPTTNQVTDLLRSLDQSPFAGVAVEELLLRRYKPVPDRLRPEDEMIGHTGYLLFARAISSSIDTQQWLSRDRKRYRARQRAAVAIKAEEKRRAQEIADGGPKYPRLPLPG
ncbi:MAG: tRNA (adenine-N1)-methyltransferase [Caldilineaceae bacterium]|nr:tRNA (adenine-N1)-methyltransferase [Caldilineaceae bacterium]